MEAYNLTGRETTIWRDFMNIGKCTFDAGIVNARIDKANIEYDQTNNDSGQCRMSCGADIR